MSPGLDLRLPGPERRRAAALVGAWRDLLYVPGPDFASSLDPGVYRSSFAVVLADGRAVRVSSLLAPAFGAALCRIRLESLASYRAENLGSFFDPERRGIVYAMAADRRGGGARPRDRPDWSYGGSSLAPRLRHVARVRVLRERAAGSDASGSIWWVADRGLVLTTADRGEVLFLACPEEAERAALVTDLGLYRALIDPAWPAVPGASRRELLGYAEHDGRLELALELEDAAAAD